jgi:hypothetical protein
MSALSPQAREAFAHPTLFLVKLTPEGFSIDGQVHSQLAGRIHKTRLLRKLFDDSGALLCHSKDGMRAVNGTLCAACLHPRCRPGLRIHFGEGARQYLLDLNATSAQNLVALEEHLSLQNLKLEGRRLLLSVLNRGHWGEVRFESLP